ncbi:putative quinol monooxygenase [Marinobacterium sedimentorum]|uniref:putative quinol monooxygenase n=1 Tax=Marinobacterium sedimentorum TaxID=2927804 RepID=UPI0020C6876D|nr:antibiotic biosynthesis monooxygenase [Marinobacterium sedimentorum]MCP8686483.1 antibiotic biosynthesis monooxygenase [Marinobacterium sedimentorum]
MSSLVYCTAQFKPRPGKDAELFAKLQTLEPNTLREDGCVQYRVTRQISSPFADGESYPIVFHEIWQDMKAFEQHCQRREISEFFSRYCESPNGLAQAWNVCVYSDAADEPA